MLADEFLIHSPARKPRTERRLSAYYHRIASMDWLDTLIADLVRKAPVGFGRTMLMKCLNFFQTVRRVSLGYHFGLYT
jgi:hypothetical protein